MTNESKYCVVLTGDEYMRLYHCALSISYGSMHDSKSIIHAKEILSILSDTTSADIKALDLRYTPVEVKQ